MDKDNNKFDICDKEQKDSLKKECNSVVGIHEKRIERLKKSPIWDVYEKTQIIQDESTD